MMVPLNWRQIAASGAIWRYFSRRGYLGIALMGWSSAEGEIGASGWLESPFFAFAMAAPSPAQAQRPIPTPTAEPLPTPRSRPRPVWPTSAAIFWSGRRISERADSSAPGEAIRAAAAPRRRLRGTISQLGEVYGISTRTGAQLDFVGDQRQTSGGVAGTGARVNGETLHSLVLLKLDRARRFRFLWRTIKTVERTN